MNIRAVASEDIGAGRVDRRLRRRPYGSRLGPGRQTHPTPVKDIGLITERPMIVLWRRLRAGDPCTHMANILYVWADQQRPPRPAGVELKALLLIITKVGTLQRTLVEELVAIVIFMLALKSRIVRAC